MGRLALLVVGAAAGVVAVRRFGRMAQSYTPEGMQDSLSRLADTAADFAATVREGAAEREQELRVALGVDAGVISPEAARELIENPTSTRA